MGTQESPPAAPPSPNSRNNTAVTLRSIEKEIDLMEPTLMRLEDQLKSLIGMCVCVCVRVCASCVCLFVCLWCVCVCPRVRAHAGILFCSIEKELS